MRRQLFTDPVLLLGRIGEWADRRLRRRALKDTAAAKLHDGYLDSLELLQLAAKSVDIEVIYDVGANRGTWAVLAKSVFPEATIHAFEPLDLHFDAFRTSTQGFADDVTLHPVALGQEARAVALNVTTFSDASSILPLTRVGETQWNLSMERTTQVPLVRLDAYAREAGLAAPDLIKLDVQGFELAVLEGTGSLLDQVSALIIELSFEEFYAGQSLWFEVGSTLAQRGFVLHALASTTPLGCRLMQADVLFIRQSAS